MVKRLLLTLLLAALLLPTAALAEAQVIDDANAISADMEQRITEIIDRVERKHQVDLVVLVTYDVPDDYSDSLYRVMNYADDYYDNGGYGMGEDFSGMLYLIDLNNRVQWISTGGVMMEYINDYREERILDAAEMYLQRSDWGRAAFAAMEMTEEFMNQGREKGMFLYDETTGRRLSGLYNPLEPFEILIAAAAGVAVAVGFAAAVKGRYSLKGSTYHYDVNANSDCTLTADDEQYLRQSVTRMARSTGGGGGHSGGGRSGGSGVHRSSSGRSHGGGGRRF